MLNDYIRNEAWRIRNNQAYFDLNIQTHSDTPESALAYARKLVEIDPKDVKHKYQLGQAELRAGNPIAANDVMTSIAPDDEVGMLEAHIWRSRYLVQNKNAQEFKAVIGQAEKHLNLAIEADKESLTGKSELANLYMNYANMLEERSPERLEYLIKADKEYRGIIDDDTNSRSNSSVQITTLSPSVLVRKQLEAINPEKYSLDTEIPRVRADISNFLRAANRYKLQDIRLWLILINSASEIRQFDFAVDIANQGLKVLEDPKGRAGLISAKSFTLRKAALTINKFEEFKSYRDRFTYLCEAVRAARAENSNYLLLLQFVGQENPEPTIQVARRLGLATPGDPVPIKPEWLYRLCLDPKYTGFATSLIGLQEFHVGNNEDAIKNWSVAQQFDLSTREFIAKLIEVELLSKSDKLAHLETILEEALLVYPEAIRIRMLRGLFYTREKKFQAAIDDFRVVVDNKPNEVLLHQRIKACYLFMGQRRAAADEQKIIDAKVQRLPEESQAKILEMLRQMDARQSAAP